MKITLLNTLKSLNPNFANLTLNASTNAKLICFVMSITIFFLFASAKAAAAIAAACFLFSISSFVSCFAVNVVTLSFTESTNAVVPVNFPKIPVKSFEPVELVELVVVSVCSFAIKALYIITETVTINSARRINSDAFIYNKIKKNENYKKYI